MTTNEILFYVGLILGSILFVVSVVLFFVLKVPSSVAFLLKMNRRGFKMVKRTTDENITAYEKQQKSTTSLKRNKTQSSIMQDGPTEVLNQETVTGTNNLYKKERGTGTREMSRKLSKNKTKTISMDGPTEVLEMDAAEEQEIVKFRKEYASSRLTTRPIQQDDEQTGVLDSLPKTKRTKQKLTRNKPQDTDGQTEILM